MIDLIIRLAELQICWTNNIFNENSIINDTHRTEINKLHTNCLYHIRTNELCLRFISFIIDSTKHIDMETESKILIKFYSHRPKRACCQFRAEFCVGKTSII